MSTTSSDSTTSPSISSSNTSSSSNSNKDGSEIIIKTLQIYGTLFVLSWLVYISYLQHRFPKYFNIRSWSSSNSSTSSSSNNNINPNDQNNNNTTTTTTPNNNNNNNNNTINLAQTKYTYWYSWIYEVFTLYTDEQLLYHCNSLDVICFLRALRFGRVLSMLGCCNAIYLIPLYYTATTTSTSSTSNDNDDNYDPLQLISVSNLPSYSKRFIGTVFAAYITYIYTMYLIYLEYQWYTKYKHIFLSQTISRNYTVYVSGIPRAYRSSQQLANYFRQCCNNNNNSYNTNNSVYEAHIAMETSKLDKYIERRKYIIQKLEHIMAVQQRTGQRISHRTLKKRNITTTNNNNTSNSNNSTLTLLGKVESIQTYEMELQILNRKITTAVQDIRQHNQYNNNSYHHHYHHHRNGRSCNNNTITMKNNNYNNNNSSNRSVVSNNNNNNNNNSASSIRQRISPNSQRHLLLKRYTASKDLMAAIRADLRSDTNDESDDDDESDDNDNNDNNNNNNNNNAKSDQQNETSNNEHNNNVEVFLKSLSDDNTERMDVDNNQDMSTTEYHRLPSVLDIIGEVSKEEDSPQKNNVSQGPLDNDKKDDEVIDPVAGQQQQQRTGSQNFATIHTSIRQGMVSSGSAVRDSIGTIVSTSKNAGTTIMKSSINAGSTIMKSSKIASTTFIQTASDTGAETIRRAQSVGTNVIHSAGSVVPLLRNKTEGKATDAGFVVFTSLYATQAVLQMIHHPKPYVMSVIPAGHEDDIYWRNVGLRHQAKRSGTLTAFAATSVLCFFWSVPMAFISSLTEISTIKESLPKLGVWIEKYPFMEAVLAQLAPLMLLIFNEAILPVVLKYFATWEGHVSSSLLEASLFVKLGCFMVISGGIWATLTDIIDDPENLITLLASALPDRSSYFIQIVLAQTFFLQSMELLRVYPLTVHFLRQYIGPRLTKKERSQPYFILYPLEHPPDFWHAETFAQLILFYMISFVYGPIAPITSIVLFVCFVILECGYRYQFVHNYPKSHTDSGGRLWKFFIHFTLGCMVVAQLTLIGILLLKQSHYAGPAMGPLLAMTILFIFFINDEHAKVSEFLPTRDCILKDYENNNNNDNSMEDETEVGEGTTTMSMEFVKNAYLQPSLRNSDPIEPDYENL